MLLYLWVNCPFKSCSCSSRWKTTPVYVLPLQQDLSKCSAPELFDHPHCQHGTCFLPSFWSFCSFVPASCFLSLLLSLSLSLCSFCFECRLPTSDLLFPLSLLSHLFLIRVSSVFYYLSMSSSPSSSLFPHLLFKHQ